ncbi:hypothetical protein [Cellulosimicrobium marinum]|uniref:hypothetical protein n=1 Tax=Cellulosimicrobium marinum TaxID=1638992 RepID=UPI001E3017C5|nr:hypothetical protein [Cellulosimicrobium marinum]MCB7138284.1 hypothetical protein [Cellulosimicrobium marinum]
MMRTIYAMAAQPSAPVDSLRSWEVIGVWVGGLAAAIAAGFAVWLAADERRRARKERADARARTLRDQANQIYAWVDAVVLAEDSPEMGATVRWQNASGQPVWDFETEPLRGFDSSVGPFTRSIRHKFLPPGPVQAETFGFTADYHEGTQAVRCSFRDASGNTWEKDHVGSLIVTGGPDESEIRSYELAKNSQTRRFPRVIAGVLYSWREAPRQYRDRLN